MAAELGLPKYLDSMKPDELEKVMENQDARQEEIAKMVKKFQPSFCSRLRTESAPRPQGSADREDPRSLQEYEAQVLQLI